MMSIETLVCCESAESTLTNAENFERSLRAALGAKPDDIPAGVDTLLETLHKWAQRDLASKRALMLEVV